MFQFVCLFRQSAEETLSVFPTVVSTAVSGRPDDLIAAEHALYFERKLICRCASLFSAMTALMMSYYVFDVRYPDELANTFNFLDVYVGGVDRKSKVRPAVQRRINLLHAD